MGETLPRIGPFLSGRELRFGGSKVEPGPFPIELQCLQAMSRASAGNRKSAPRLSRKAASKEKGAVL